MAVTAPGEILLNSNFIRGLSLQHAASELTGDWRASAIVSKYLRLSMSTLAQTLEGRLPAQCAPPN